MAKENGLSTVFSSADLSFTLTILFLFRIAGFSSYWLGEHSEALKIN